LIEKRKRSPRKKKSGEKGKLSRKVHHVFGGRETGKLTTVAKAEMSMESSISGGENPKGNLKITTGEIGDKRPQKKARGTCVILRY